MKDVVRRRNLHGRGLTSLLAGLSFLLLMVTGVVLFVTPQGRVAHWMDWRVLGLGKEQWSSVHMTIGLLFVTAAIIHLVFNFKAFWNYLTRKIAAGRRLAREMLLATAICVTVAGGTLWEIPPFRQIIGLNTDIKAYWDRTSHQIPYAHAEESSLSEFAERIGLSQEELTAALKAGGFSVPDVKLTVGELAREKGVSPSDLFQVIKKQHPEIGARQRGGKGRGGGARRQAN